MNLHQAIQVFLSYLEVERQAISKRKMEEFALSENLDTLIAVEEDCKPGEVYYCTVHGFRSLDSQRSHLNQFVVAIKGDGFSRARNLPYLRKPAKKSNPPQLIVQYPDSQAGAAGYAEAVLLPLDRNSTYIEKIDMLDTEYAAMLVDEPRF